MCAFPKDLTLAPGQQRAWLDSPENGYRWQSVRAQWYHHVEPADGKPHVVFWAVFFSGQIPWCGCELTSFWCLYLLKHGARRTVCSAVSQNPDLLKATSHSMLARSRPVSKWAIQKVVGFKIWRQPHVIWYPAWALFGFFFMLRPRLLHDQGLHTWRMPRTAANGKNRGHDTSCYRWAFGLIVLHLMNWFVRLFT